MHTYSNFVVAIFCENFSPFELKFFSQKLSFGFQCIKMDIVLKAELVGIPDSVPSPLPPWWGAGEGGCWQWAPIRWPQPGQRGAMPLLTPLSV